LLIDALDKIQIEKTIFEMDSKLPMPQPTTELERVLHEEAQNLSNDSSPFGSMNESQGQVATGHPLPTDELSLSAGEIAEYKSINIPPMPDRKETLSEGELQDVHPSVASDDVLSPGEISHHSQSHPSNPPPTTPAPQPRQDPSFMDRSTVVSPVSPSMVMSMPSPHNSPIASSDREMEDPNAFNTTVEFQQGHHDGPFLDAQEPLRPDNMQPATLALVDHTYPDAGSEVKKESLQEDANGGGLRKQGSGEWTDATTVPTDLPDDDFSDTELNAVEFF
jgi:hypothetical protein